VQRKAMQLEIEREALKKEKDKASVERLKKLEKELADLKTEIHDKKAKWENEKEGHCQDSGDQGAHGEDEADDEGGRTRGQLYRLAELQYGEMSKLGEN